MIAISPSTQLKAQDSPMLSQVWQTIDESSCPYSYNFHMHTVCSDGQLTPLALIEQAAKIGLKGMAITDHHSVGGYRIAQKWLSNATCDRNYNNLPHLWTGVEITANLEGIDVHILGYAFAPQHSAIQPYLQGKRPEGKEAEAERVIAAIHQAGGLVVLAHPARYRRSPQEIIAIVAGFGIDGVEAYYAYDNPSLWKPSKRQTKQVKQLASQYNLLTTCGTDTHGTNLLRRV